MVIPRLIWCRLELQVIVHARCLAEASAGRSMAARIAMMAMTTSNSIKVKASRRLMVPQTRQNWLCYKNTDLFFRFGT